MKTITNLILVILCSVTTSTHAGLFEREISFSEIEIQETLTKSGAQTKNYGWLSVSLLEAPKITLGIPEGRIGIIARIHVSLLGNRAIPVDIVGTSGIRYNDADKGFYLDNPVVHSVASQAIPKEAEASARQASNNLISSYFKSKPLYVLRDDGSPQEATAHWLLKSVRIEPGKAIATLSTF